MRFSREALIKSLPPLDQYCSSRASTELRSYLKHYQLASLSGSCKYSIGRLLLDEVQVAVQRFSQTQRESCRGSIVVVHGYMDHMGLYQHLIKYLYACGFDVICYDLSGHGLSDGAPLDVESFEHYAIQLDQLLRHPSLSLQHPVHLIGQSTGGAIICGRQRLLADPHALPGGQCVLLAPLIRPALWRSIKRRFRWLKYVLRRVPRRLSQNSHDPEFIEFIAQHDPLQHKVIPVGWIGAMLAWGDWIEQQAAFDTRLHIIQGTDDLTVDWQHNMAIFERLYPNSRFNFIENARHHLVNESEHYRKLLFKYLDAALCEQAQ